MQMNEGSVRHDLPVASSGDVVSFCDSSILAKGEAGFTRGEGLCRNRGLGLGYRVLDSRDYNQVMSTISFQEIQHDPQAFLRRIESGEPFVVVEGDRALAEVRPLPNAATKWAAVDAIYQRLQKSGKGFSDSADLLREDRDR
jgi:antitoxin (DNA-binding transcriptional repressor) of toxin-antitoxin stability system